MEKYIYPAIYHEADDGGYWVSFPDFSGVYTQGASLEETYDMCVDCLGLTISTWDETSKEPLPVPADLRDIKTGEGEHVVLIRFDMEDYYKKLNKRLIKIFTYIFYNTSNFFNQIFITIFCTIQKLV